MLRTKSGFVFILEKNQILIFNEDLGLVQPPLKGYYSGLTEEEDGSVGTLQVFNWNKLLSNLMLLQG